MKAYRRRLKQRYQERELSRYTQPEPDPPSWQSMLFGITPPDAAIVAGKILWEKNNGNHR